MSVYFHVYWEYLKRENEINYADFSFQNPRSRGGLLYYYVAHSTGVTLLLKHDNKTGVT